MSDFARPKEKKTAQELEAMILADLSNMDGCPRSGDKVTVYGISWGAMLTFGTAAGPVPNRTELRTMFDIITERLQRPYEIE